jgi:Spy/CpxP family protein refolding chaperone
MMEVRSMKRLSSLRTVTLVLAAALLVTTAAYAAGGAMDEGRGHRFQSRMQQSLGLTDDQVQALRQLRENAAPAFKQHWQSVSQAQRELRRLVVTGADEGAIQAKQAEVENYMKQGLQMRVDMLKAAAPILTAEQREKFVDAMDHAFRFHGHRHGRPAARS